MTIAEAKGQEFESVLIAFPFSDCPEKIFVKNLFVWYTAITRAKNYVGIIISSKERSWLESNVINLDDLNKIFDDISLNKEEELSDFIEQLSRFGFHRMTDEQSKLEKVRHIFKQIQIFLQQGILKSSLVNKEEEVWDLLDTIISQQDYREQYFSSGLDQIREKQALENISRLGLGAVLTFYVAVLPLLIEIDNYTHVIKEIDLILMNNLNFYFQEGEEDKITVFENIKNPICLCLLYRGNRKFWKAAQQLREQSGTETPNAKLITDFLYKQINDDYIRNGLPWSAARFRYHFLKEKPNELLPFTDLLKESSDDDHLFGSLVPHLIGEIQDFSSNLKKEFSNE